MAGRFRSRRTIGRGLPQFSRSENGTVPFRNRGGWGRAERDPSGSECPASFGFVLAGGWGRAKRAPGGGGWLASFGFVFAAGGPLWGKAAFIAVFVLLLIWLLLMPGRLIGHTDGPPAWWRNTRFWAIAVTVIQILVYLRWG